MYHVIWTGRQMLTLTSKFDCLFTFFVFCHVKKMSQTMRNFHVKIMQPFLNLDCAPQKFTGTVEKPNNQNISNSMQISTFYDLSKWHDPHISRCHSRFWILGYANPSTTFYPNQKCNDPEIFSHLLYLKKANKKTLSHQKSYF